jgi:hypothetical protein
MAQHQLETIAKPAADAPASEWEKYIEGITTPDANASSQIWDEYWRLTQEAEDEAPEATYANRTPTVDPNLLGVGSKGGTKR